MHELSIAQEIFSIIEKTLGFKKELKSVSVTVGPLSGISPESLDFCFCEVADIIGYGRPELIMNLLKAYVQCRKCNCKYEVKDYYSCCPQCDCFDKEILSGNEFTVDSVELLEKNDV